MSKKVYFSAVFVSMICIATGFYRPCAGILRYSGPISMNQDENDSTVTICSGNAGIKVLILHKPKVFLIDYGCPELLKSLICSKEVDLLKCNDTMPLKAIDMDSLDLCNFTYLSGLMQQILYDLLKMNLLRNRGYDSQIPIERQFVGVLQIYGRQLSNGSIKSKLKFSRKKISGLAVLYISELRKIKNDLYAINTNKYY